MSKPQPFVEGGTGHHYIMDRSDYFAITDVMYTVLALVAQKARDASSEPVFRVPAMESTAQHATTDPGEDMLADTFHVLYEAISKGVPIPRVTSIIGYDMCTYSVLYPRRAGFVCFSFAGEVPSKSTCIICMLL